MNQPPAFNLQREIANIVQCLAGGAVLRRTDDSVELVTRHNFDHVALTHLMHHGWLESMANGGTFKLTDAGLLAYLRSTDELGDGKLVDPVAEYQP